MPMTASVLHDDGIAILALAGELDLATRPRLDTALDAVLADGLRSVLIDLDALTFCDSSGLGALLRAHRVTTQVGASVVVAAARGPVARLLVLTNLAAAVRVEPEVQPALQRLRSSPRTSTS